MCVVFAVVVVVGFGALVLFDGLMFYVYVFVCLLCFCCLFLRFNCVGRFLPKFHILSSVIFGKQIF